MTWLPDEAVDRLRRVAQVPDLPTERYTLGDRIGRGGMGTVFRARDTWLDRDVAIKVSNAPAADTDLERRLTREARVLAHLEHPGIVPVHDAGTLADGRWFYVMKLVHGKTLAAADRPADEAGALAVFVRVVEAVAFAHAAGIVHRDLKPSNVMVGRFGEVLVLDWGVARLVSGTSGDGPAGAAGGSADAADAPGPDTRTAAGTRLGTPGFMPPEQADGHASAAGPAADVYSLGALLAWLLTGEAAGDGPDQVERRLRGAPARPARRLRAIVRQCLAPAPEHRYPDAAALLEDLARYRSGRSVTAHRETLLDRAERFFTTYRAAILLVGAYLVMRTVFAFTQR